MQEKLELKKYYLSKDTFVKDMLKIFSNARLYNKASTIFYRYANDLEKFVQPLFENLIEPQSYELEQYKLDILEREEKEAKEEELKAEAQKRSAKGRSSINPREKKMKLKNKK
jgi:hypothetical protein